MRLLTDFVYLMNVMTQFYVAIDKPLNHIFIRISQLKISS
jgi:hypothetical protein